MLLQIILQMIGDYSTLLCALGLDSEESLRPSNKILENQRTIQKTQDAFKAQTP